MRKEQFQYFSNQKKPKYFGNNKPRVDWLKIIWKCHDKFKWPSVAESFAHGQELDFGVWELTKLQERHYSGQKGHKTPRRNLFKPEDPTWDSSGLNCDDPLFDGKPVF